MSEPDMDQDHSTAPIVSTPDSGPTSTKRGGFRETIGSVGFWAGFFGFFVLNAVALVISIGLSMLVEQPWIANNPQISSVMSLLLPIGSLIVFIANIAALPLLAVKKRRAFWGVLTAWGALFILVICAGVIFTIYCFSEYARMTP